MIDEFYRLPLSAIVTAAEGKTMSDSRTGSFALDLTAASRSLEVSRMGFDSESLRVEDLREGGQVVLSSSKGTTIRLVDGEGGPTASLRGVLFPRDGARGEGVAFEPDAVGVWQGGLTVPSMLELGGAAARQAYFVRPGDDLTIVLPSEMTRVAFLDQAGLPMAGLKVELHRIASDSSQPLRVAMTSNDRGEIEIAWAATGSIILDEPGCSLEGAEPADRVIVLGGLEGVCLQGEHIPEVRVDVFDARAGLMLREPDGDWVEGPVGVAFDLRSSTGAWYEGSVMPTRARNGEVRVPYNPDGVYDTYRLRIVADGFVPLVVDDPYVVFSATVPPEFVLERESERSLQLLFADGSPYKGAVALKQAHSSMTLQADAAGRVGPFWWESAAVLVFDDSGLELAQVDSSELSKRESVQVVLTDSPAAIEVLGAPPDASDICLKDGFGVEWSPSTYRDGAWHFSGLPSGRYLVGPRSWVRRLYRRKGYADFSWDCSVPSGGTCRLPWDARWVMSSDVVGQIRVVKDGRLVRGVFLVPEYRDCATPSPMGPGVDQIHLGPGGAYTLPAGTPRPEALLVTMSNPSPRGGGLRVFDVLHPGENKTIRLRDVRLVAKSGSEGVARVDYECKDRAWMARPTTFRFSGFWDLARSPYLLENVPEYVREIVLTDAKGNPRLIALPGRDDEQVVIGIELAR